jgi:hypothetical protein
MSMRRIFVKKILNWLIDLFHEGAREGGSIYLGIGAYGVSPISTLLFDNTFPPLSDKQ